MAETVRIEIPVEVVDETQAGIAQIVSRMNRLNHSLEQARGRTTQFDRQAERTERGLARWARQRYEILLEGRDRVSPILSTVRSGLKSFAGKAWRVTVKAYDLVTAPIRGIMNLLKNPIFQVGAVLGVSIGMKDTIETYKDFEAAMSQVQAVSGATDTQLEKLTSKAKEMGATTKFTAKESAEAFNYMAMAGWKTKDMMGGIEGILNLAAASGENLATTSDIVTDALTAFNMKASDSGHFSDVLAAAASNANTTVSGMGETFKYAGSMAGSLGYSIEDVALMTGLMANTGVKASMSGTALNSIFTRLSTNTHGAADAVKKLGIDIFDSKGNARDLSDVMEGLRKATAGMTKEEKANFANKVAGTYAQKGFLAILNASEKDYNKLSDAINNADGAAASMADTMMDNLQGSITILQSAVDGVKISFGERLSPYVRGLADWLTGQMPEVEQMLDGMMDWADVKAKQLRQKFNGMVSGEDWQDADFAGKIKIAWDEFITEPFSGWWNTTGKAAFAGFAEGIGEGLGTGLKTGVMAMLGIDLGETVDEGVSIGASFAKGFSEGFDFKTVSENLWKGLGNLLSNAGKLLPGGEPADLSSVFSAMMLSKIARPFIGMGRGMEGIGRGLFGANPATGVSLMGSFMGSTGNAMVRGSGVLGTLASAGYGLLGGAASNAGAGAYFGNMAGSMSGGKAALAGAVGVAGGLAGGLTALSGAIDGYKAVESKDRAESAAYAKSAGLKLGGAGAGALIGTLVLPGMGTAIGAGIGGIAGYISGNKVKEGYDKEMEAAREEAENAQKVFETTGLSIDKVRFKNKDLNKAMRDSSVSAEQMALLLKEDMAKTAEGAFGDIKLSLEEIRGLAEDVTFGGLSKSVGDFSAAVAEAGASSQNLEAALSSLEKQDWRAGLGMKLDKKGRAAYKDAASNFVTSSKDYVENQHYEAASALKMLMGKKADTEGLDDMYTGMQSQLGKYGEKYQKALSEALSDGVISTKDTITIKLGGVEYEMDEAKAVAKLQDKITGITDKVAEAQNEASMEALRIKYGNGADMDAESFARFQEELASQVESFTNNYDEALQVNLTNLKLQFPDGGEEYEKAVQELTEGYNAQIEKMDVRVQSFNLETIAQAWDDELAGILPEIEGTTAEKLKGAMGRALSVKPNPDTWTQEEVMGWFDLDKLVSVDPSAFENIYQEIVAAASMVPEGLKDTVIENVKDALPTQEEIAEQCFGPVSDGFKTGMLSQGIDSILQGMDYKEGFGDGIDFSGIGSGIASGIGNSIADACGGIDFSAAGSAVTGGVGSAIQNADMGQIIAGINTVRGNTESQVNSVLGAPYSTTADVNVTLNWKLLNDTANINVAGGGSTKVSASIGGHAAGGYVSGGPQLSWLAEEGYGEYVIPTNPSRRARALELYEQAGAALGVSAHAEGGYVGSPFLGRDGVGYPDFQEAGPNPSPAYNGDSDGGYPARDAGAAFMPTPVMGGNAITPVVQVSVSMSPEFVIQGGGQDGEGVMGTIRRHMGEIANELGGEIAVKLGAVFSNMPSEGA